MIKNSQKSTHAFSEACLFLDSIFDSKWQTKKQHFVQIMEVVKQCRIGELAEQLKNEGHLNVDQSAHLFRDIQDPSKLKTISHLLSSMSPKDLLKFYAQANYGNHKTVETPQHNRPRVSYLELKKKKDSRRLTKTREIPKSHNLIQMMNTFSNSIKEKYHTSTKFLSEIICNRKQKLIQSYFGKLIGLLLGTSDYAYLSWETSDPKTNIEYYNSTLNYLTVFLKGEPKHQEAIDIAHKLGQGVHLLDSSDPHFSNIFNCKSGSYIVQVVSNKTETIIFAIEPPQPDLFSNLRKHSPFAHIFELFVQQAVQTLHVSKFEIVKYYTQVTLKSILSLLEFSIRVDAKVFQIKIEEFFKQHKSIGNITDIIEHLRKGGAEDKLIIQLYEDICDRIFRYETSINKYKLQVSENFRVYLNFNPFGELRFVSNKLPSSIYKRLLLKQRSEDEEVTIFDLFDKDSDVLNAFDEAVDGKIYEQPVEFKQDSKYYGQVLFNYKEDGTLNHFSCYIDLKAKLEKREKSEKSFKNLSMDTIVSTDSEKDVTTQIRQGTGINKQAQRMLLELEQQRPGVSKTGWLEAFMKNDVVQKYSRKKPVQVKKDLDSKENARKRASITMGLDPQSDLHRTLMLMDRFDFNLLLVDKEHLIPLAKAMLSKLRFTADSNFDQSALDNFLKQISTKYAKHQNPFHNFTHGLNVMHMCYLLTKLEGNRDYLSDINSFALVFSGLCHDVGHPGRTNPFEISSASKKAIRYNDRSPLQSYHAATSYKILLRPGNNFLSSVKKEHFTQIRKQFVSNILATDIKQHFPLLNNFEAKLKSPKGFEKIPADIELTTNILIHSSDFSGASMTFDISRQWAELVNKEFTSQYQEEGQLGLPQTPYMKNLEKEDVLAQNEAGFMKVIVRPLFKALSDYYHKEEEIKRLLKNVDENMLIWEKISAEHKAKLENKA